MIFAEVVETLGVDGFEILERGACAVEVAFAFFRKAEAFERAAFHVRVSRRERRLQHGIVCGDRVVPLRLVEVRGRLPELGQNRCAGPGVLVHDARISRELGVGACVERREND